MTHRRIQMLAAIAVLLLLVSVVTETQSSGEVALRVAMETEKVKGDLRAAIEQYKRIVSGRDRALAAKALLRMAECYYKLGDSDARATYERVVRDYADQNEQVAAAKARLGDRGAVAYREARVVALDPTVVFPGTVSADGRFVSFSNRATGDVVVRDLVTGTDRVLRKATPAERGSYSVMSRDGTQVAFIWGSRGSGQGTQILIAKVQGNGADVRRLVVGGSVLPLDWSPDGKWLAVAVVQGSSPQVAVVSAQDGGLRVLKSMEGGRFPRNIFFSPDSRYIAYSQDVRGTRNTRVLVMAMDGDPRESAVVDHPSENHIMGWSPDGASLLFASDRNGSSQLWRVPVRDGRSLGAPVQAATDLGPDPVSLGVTSSGTLHVWKFTRTFHVNAASIDLNSGTLLTNAAGSFREFVGGGGKPTWSTDGQQLAYVACAASCDRTSVIKIRAVDTGQVRELPMRLAYLQAQTDLVWSPDGRTLTVNATDMNGRFGFHQIDTQTGDTRPSEIALIGTPPSPFHGTNVSADGTKVYFSSQAVGGRIIERDIASGKDRVVFDERAGGNTVTVASSPNRRYTAFVETTSTKVSTLFVMPYGGGEPRELFRSSGFDVSGRLGGFDLFGRHGMVWTPDSRAILMIAGDGQTSALWLLPVSGEPPRRLEIDVANWPVSNFVGGFSLRPDGRQLAFVAGELKEEILALEHVLPVSSAKR